MPLYNGTQSPLRISPLTAKLVFAACSTTAFHRTMARMVLDLDDTPKSTDGRFSFYNARRMPICACTTRPAAAGSNIVEADSYDSPLHPSAVGR